MQRAPILSALIGLVMSIVLGFLYYSAKKGVLVIVVLAVLGMFVLSNISLSSNDFIYSKISVFSAKNDNYVENRLYLNKKGDFELSGDGAGRHSMTADKYNPGTSMRDGEYMKMLQEQGYIGLFIFLLLCICVILKSVYNFRNCYFEFTLFIMLLICMIGANPISTSDKHPIIYWLAFGQIARYDYISYLKEKLRII